MAPPAVRARVDASPPADSVSVTVSVAPLYAQATVARTASGGAAVAHRTSAAAVARAAARAGVVLRLISRSPPAPAAPRLPPPRAGYRVPPGPPAQGRASPG